MWQSQDWGGVTWIAFAKFSAIIFIMQNYMLAPCNYIHIWQEPRKLRCNKPVKDERDIENEYNQCLYDSRNKAQITELGNWFGNPNQYNHCYIRVNTEVFQYSRKLSLHLVTIIPYYVDNMFDIWYTHNKWTFYNWNKFINTYKLKLRKDAFTLALTYMYVSEWRQMAAKGWYWDLTSVKAV